MARKIFIAAIDKNSGKTTTSISLVHLARKKYRRVGFLKPFGGQSVNFHGKIIDKDVALMAQVFDLNADLRLMSPVVLSPDTTRKVVDGAIRHEELQERIVQACAELEKQCDFLLVEGSGHPMELIKEPSLIIATSSRNELLVTLAHLYQMPAYRPLIVGLVISGSIPVNGITQQILDKSKIPYMRAEDSISANLYQTINRDVAKIVFEDQEKLDLIRSLADTTLDFDAIERLFSL